MTTIKKAIKLKTGETLPAGSQVTQWSPGGKHHLVDVEGRKVRVTSAFKTPSMSSLEKWSNDGIAKTPTGKRVEPDGFGSDGSPSWLLILGFI